MKRSVSEKFGRDSLTLKVRCFGKSFLMFFSVLLLLAGAFPETLNAQPGMRMGRVIILLTSNSDVDSAKVYINGKIKGTARRGQGLKRVTPFGSGKKTTIELRSGKHTKKKTVVLSGKEWKTVRFTIKTVKNGNIKVRYSGDSYYKVARLFLNGEFKKRIRRGSTFLIRDLKPNQGYRIKLQNGTEKVTKKIRLGSGQTKTVSIKLEAPVGFLNVRYRKNSAFRKAELYVNGKRQAKLTRGESHSLELMPGNYTVKLVHGSTSKARRVRITRGVTKTVVLQLRQKQGRLVITYQRNSAYRTAKLYINGQYKATLRRGSTKTLRLRQGLYTVKVEQNNESQKRKLRVRRGKDTKAGFRLRGLNR